MIEIYYDALLKRVRETLMLKKSIAVLGWMDRNHNELTRQLLRDDKIVFFEVPKLLSEKFGLVLFTRFLYHTEIERIKTEKFYPTAIDIGIIKKIFEACKDLLVSSPTPSIADRAETTIEKQPLPVLIPEAPMNNDKLDLSITREENCKMDDMEAFAKNFLEAAEQNGINPGHIGKTTLGRMRKTCGIESTTAQLVSAGWVIGVVGAESTNVGWYKPGPKMVTSGKPEEKEPEDKYALAKFLVNKKPQYIAQKEEIEKAYIAQKAEIERQLARVEVAEKLLEGFSKLE